MGRALLSLLKTHPSRTLEAVDPWSKLPVADKAVLGNMQDTEEGQTVDQRWARR